MAQSGDGGRWGRGKVYQVFCIVSTDQSVAGMTDSQPGRGLGAIIGSFRSEVNLVGLVAHCTWQHRLASVGHAKLANAKLSTSIFLLAREEK